MFQEHRHRLINIVFYYTFIIYHYIAGVLWLGLAMRMMMTEWDRPGLFEICFAQLERFLRCIV
jgi:hypothetical protein